MRFQHKRQLQQLQRQRSQRNRSRQKQKTHRQHRLREQQLSIFSQLAPQTEDTEPLVETP